MVFIKFLFSIKIQTGEREGRTLVISSAYLDYNDTVPVSTQLRNLIKYGQQKDLDLIVGCDANSHYIVWGSSNTNRREVVRLLGE